MKNMSLSLNTAFYVAIITLGTPNLQAAEEEHPFGVPHALMNHARELPRPTTATPTHKGFATTTNKDARFFRCAPYINIDIKEFHELPEYLKPDQINSRDKNKRAVLFNNFDKPVYLVSDLSGRLYFMHTDEAKNNIKICYRINRDGTINPIPETKNVLKGEIIVIIEYQNFFLTNAILIHIKRLLEKESCFLSVKGTIYSLSTEHPLPKSGKNRIELYNRIRATEPNGNTTYLAHLLIGYNSLALELKIRNKEFSFFTKNCLTWRKSKDLDILNLIQKLEHELEAARQFE